MVDIQMKYVIKPTDAFNRSAIFFQAASLFLLITVFFFELLYASSPHRLLFPAGKTLLGPLGHLIHDSTFSVLSWFHFSGVRVIHAKVSLV